MDIKCVNGEIVMTFSSGHTIKFNRKYYEDFIDNERRMLANAQVNIDEAEKMIERIDDDVTSKVTE